jgi:uncharacterized protein (TIRG00374 family)
MRGLTEPVPQERTRTRRGSGVWWRLVLLAALLTAAILLFDLRAVGTAVISVPPAIVILAIVLATLDRFLMGFKWRQLIHAGGERIRLRDAVSAYYQAAFTGRLIPAAAAHDVLRAYVANRCGVTPGLLLGSIALEKVIGMLASVAVAALGMSYLLVVSGFDAGTRILLITAIGVGTAVSAAALFIALSARLHRWGGRFAERWAPRRAARLARKASEAALSYRHRGAVMVVNFILAVAEYGLQIMKLVVLAVGLGIAMPLVPLMAAVALAIYARRVIAYVESWGLAEASGVATFVLLGIDPELAFALAVANYAVNTIAVLPGGYLLYRTGAGRGRPETTGPDDEAPYGASHNSMSSV